MKNNFKIEELLNKINFSKRNGLCPTIVQEEKSNEILMLGYSNKISLEKTLISHQATFWSTSKNSIWEKGKTSGNRLKVSKILLDCDNDALIYIVSLEGQGACHTKDQTGNYRKSCFHQDFLLS